MRRPSSIPSYPSGPPLDQRQKLEALTRELSLVRQQMLEATGEASGALLNAPMDTQWAHRDERFDRVLHVFHQEWHGIRAAAGYSPGKKLAITSQRLLTADELRPVLDAVDAWRINCVVLHGNSDTAEQTLRVIRRHAGLPLQVGAVWHGNTSQFHHGPERQQFEKLLSLKTARVLDRIAAIKPGMPDIFQSLHRALVFVFPPRVESLPSVSLQLQGAALIPVPNDWRKNFYTNLYAGLLASRIQTLHVTTSFSDVADVGRAKTIIEHPHMGRTELFRLLLQVDLILNASLSECQPMTALEGLVHGVPCITGPLSLEALERHPYTQLTQVTGVDAVNQVHAAIERVLDWRQNRATELAALMTDYHSQWVQKALIRLGEFAYP